MHSHIRLIYEHAVASKSPDLPKARRVFGSESQPAPRPLTPSATPTSARPAHPPCCEALSQP